MLKKILATALAAAMIFGLASTAFAANFSDIAGNKNEAAIKRLAAVGIFGGYPDGTFKPGNPITRAEFSKIIVVALGFADTAEMMATVPTGFSDVPVDHWANGFISVAASQGIVKGDPAGTFRPDANVTYAEAVTMVMRALGYEPVLKNGVWPTAYLTKATSIGITGSLSFVANAPATRGDVATLLSNSLTEPWLEETEWDSNGNPVRFAVPDDPADQQTFLDAMGFSKSSTKVLVDSPDLFGNDGETVQLDGEAAKTLAADTEYAGLLGHRVVFWYNSSGDVFFIEDKTSASDIKTADFDSIVDAADAEDDEVNLEVDDEVYNVQGVPIIYNFAGAEDIDVADPATIPDNADDITVVFYDGKPVSVLAFEYDYAVVGSVSVSRERITCKAGDISALALEGYDVTMLLDGESIDFGDLEEDDVIQAIVDNDAEKAYIVVTRDTVDGELSRVIANAANAKFKVGDTWYDAADSFDMVAGDVTAMLGSDVSLVLDKNGDVQYIIELSEDKETLAGLVLDLDVDAMFGDTCRVTVLTAAGEVEKLQGTEDFYDGGAGDFGDLAVGDVIEYTLDDGLIDTAEVVLEKAAYGPDAAPEDGIPDTGVDLATDEDGYLQWKTGQRDYRLTDDTVVFWADGAWSYNVGTDEFTFDNSELEVTTMDDILANETISGYVSVDSGNITYVVVLDASESDDYIWGVVLNSWQSGSSEYGITVLADGTEKDYTSIDSTLLDWDESDVIRFDPAGEEVVDIEDGTDYEVSPSVASGVYWVIEDIDGDMITVVEYTDDAGSVGDRIDGTEVELFVDENTLLYYDKTGSTNPVSIDLDEVAKGAVVRIFTEDADDTTPGFQADDTLTVLVVTQW